MWRAKARERACICKCVSVGSGQVRASAGDILNGQQQSMSDLGGHVVKDWPHTYNEGRFQQTKMKAGGGGRRTTNKHFGAIPQPNEKFIECQASHSLRFLTPHRRCFGLGSATTIVVPVALYPRRILPYFSSFRSKLCSLGVNGSIFDMRSCAKLHRLTPCFKNLDFKN